MFLSLLSSSSPLSSLPLPPPGLSTCSSAHPRRRSSGSRRRGGEGPFRSVEDFARRSGLSRAVITRLAKAGAFGSLRLDRRTALWEVLGQRSGEHCRCLTVGCVHARDAVGRTAANCDASMADIGVLQPALAEPCRPTALPPMSPAEEVLADYRTAGLSLRAHPLEFLRAELSRRGVATARSLQTLPDGKPVCVAGIVLVRQRPGTAKGITFVTLEDETGTANLIVRPAVWRRYRQAALTATVLLAHGRLQRQGQVIHVLTTGLEDLSPWLGQLDKQSRDFC